MLPLPDEGGRVTDGLEGGVRNPGPDEEVVVPTLPCVPCVPAAFEGCWAVPGDGLMPSGASDEPRLSAVPVVPPPPAVAVAVALLELAPGSDEATKGA